MTLPVYLRPSAEGTRVTLYVTPSAKDEIVGPHGGALRIRVSAPPTGGRANRAVCSLIAQGLGIEDNRVLLRSGATSRHKVVDVRGMAPETVAAAVSGVLSSRAHESRQEDGEK
ncbi:MAG: DUF167 domain-containing protein [Actinomycetota bacterium]|nr:DUF167 domain-containing protein [Actinomycetota bacterium]